MKTIRSFKRKPIRSFVSSALHHVYHRAKDHGIIFYSIEDRLVHYTVLAVNSKKHKIKVLAVSIMYSHTHQSLMAQRANDIIEYCHDSETSFVRMYNYEHGRDDRLIEERFGWAQKTSNKSARTNIIYVYNNHVEKGLCKEAVDERWSFIAYLNSDHPFSKEINRKTCSKTLLRYLNLVDRRIQKLLPLRYKDLHRMFPKLSATEKEQFIDYVIAKYALIDFDKASSYFGSKEDMVLAINSTTGAEYDIKEEYSTESDVAYRYLTELLHKSRTHSVYSLTEEKRGQLIFDAMSTFGVSKRQLEKFFHFKF